MQKDQKRRAFEKKKNHEKKHQSSKEHISQEENVLINQLQKCSMQKLLHFLQEKFQKKVTTQKMHVEVYNLLVKRLKEFKGSLENIGVYRLNKLLEKYIQRNLSKEEEKDVMTNYHIPNSIKQSLENKEFKHIQATYKNVQSKKFQVAYRFKGIIFNNTKPNMFIRYFYYSPNQTQTIYYEISFKRYLKEAIEILKKFIEFSQQVEYLHQTNLEA